tara:strand:- start:415 stop:564 length:150 start_codon:yes stop_codon:yes gene_type:complete
MGRHSTHNFPYLRYVFAELLIALGWKQSEAVTKAGINISAFYRYKKKYN